MSFTYIKPEKKCSYDNVTADPKLISIGTIEMTIRDTDIINILSMDEFHAVSSMEQIGGHGIHLHYSLIFHLDRIKGHDAHVTRQCVWRYTAMHVTLCGNTRDATQ